MLDGIVNHPLGGPAAQPQIFDLIESLDKMGKTAKHEKTGNVGATAIKAEIDAERGLKNLSAPRTEFGSTPSGSRQRPNPSLYFATR